jgi:hypothetical protein
LYPLNHEFSETSFLSNNQNRPLQSTIDNAVYRNNIVYCHIKNKNKLSEQNVKYFNDRTGGAKSRHCPEK